MVIESLFHVCGAPRLHGNIGIGIGIALGNGGYILLAMLGAAAIQHMPLLFILLQLAGARYLL